MEFALLQVGINKYPFGNSLQGCVNDCLNLTDAFTRNGLRTIQRLRYFDEHATKANILTGLNWLVKADAPTLIFQFSGHGTRVRDRNGDETSGYDSAICPVDLYSNGVITDDELADIYALVPADRKLVILFDSCHSGRSQRAFINRWKSKLFKRPTPRFIPSNQIPGQILAERDKHLTRAADYFTRRKSFLQNVERCVLLSTCRDDQTSADAYIGKQWQGAGTASLLWAWNRAGQWASYETVAKHANSWLKEHDYDQVLRVEGTRDNASKSIFS